ncbi:TPA: oligosaccharide flippase family protein [Escherichia coli]|nr:oligosaccharide flippase family protein [Escherichia coli]HAY5568786.1 oligosaccharide flippase family protein [Escherichia coli]
MNPSNKVLKNFSYLSIVQVLNYGLPLITIPIVSRALGVETIGLVNYIFSYITYFVLFVSYSFSLTAIRKLSNQNQINLIFSLVFKSQILLFLISTIIFLFVLFFIPDLKKNQNLAIIAYLLVVAALFDKSWLFQYKQDLSVVAIVNAIFKLLSMIFIVFFVSEKKDYLIYAFALSGVNLLTNLVLFITSLIKYKIQLVQTSIEDIINFLKEGKTLFFSSIVISLYTATSTLLLGLYCSNREVGLYTAATKIIDIAKVFAIMPITQLIFPLVAQKISQNLEEGMIFVKKLMPLFGLMCMILFFGMLVFGPIAINVLFGKEFVDATITLWILSSTLILILLSTVFGVLVMVNLGMDELFFKNQLYVAIISVILTLCVLPYGGAQTSAIILVISEVLITAYQYYCIKSRGYSLFSMDMLKISALKESLSVLRKN